MPYVKVAPVRDLPPGGLLEYERGDDLYAICNVNGELRAMYGVCPHQGGPLGEGALNGPMVICPWHMWEFDSKTGECALNPSLRLPVYAVRVNGEDVEADLPDA